MRANTKIVGLALGICLAALASGGVSLTGAHFHAAIVAGVTTLCAVWWVTEAIPIPATSLIPLALFPLLGILTPNQVAGAYGNQLVLLFLGGFMLSSAMERSGAHRRLALGIVSIIGCGGARRLVFGFMCASALLSMFISNTAALLMLLPIIIATVEGSDDPELRTVLILATGYAASIGGIGTPVGTPPNLLFMQAYQEATGSGISFLDWMRRMLPVVLVMLPITGLYLTRNIGRTHDITLPPVGTWRACERRTLAIFLATAILWITRTEPLGGWSTWVSMPGATDASVALLAVVAMFLIPDGRGERLLNWETASKIPWGMLLLFAGGIAIARAFTASGLSDIVGEFITGIVTMPVVFLVFAICLFVTFLTEFTSNTATAALLMPILASAAVASGVSPGALMVPAVISTSFAFMLPVATPTNAVVFGTGHVPIRRMAREGIVLNLIGVAVITAYFVMVPISFD